MLTAANTAGSAVGSGQLAIGSGQLAVGSGQLAVGRIKNQEPGRIGSSSSRKFMDRIRKYNYIANQ